MSNWKIHSGPWQCNSDPRIIGECACRPLPHPYAWCCGCVLFLFGGSLHYEVLDCPVADLRAGRASLLSVQSPSRQAGGAVEQSAWADGHGIWPPKSSQSKRKDVWSFHLSGQWLSHSFLYLAQKDITMNDWTVGLMTGKVCFACLLVLFILLPRIVE